MSGERVLSQHEIEAIASRAAELGAEQGIHQVLLRLGFDVSDPIEMQRDMLFLREWRLTCERVKSRSLLTLVSTIVVTALGLVLIGFHTYIGRQ